MILLVIDLAASRSWSADMQVFDRDTLMLLIASERALAAPGPSAVTRGDRKSMNSSRRGEKLVSACTFAT
jgi:hypothetical protein